MMWQCCNIQTNSKEAETGNGSGIHKIVDELLVMLSGFKYLVQRYIQCNICVSPTELSGIASYVYNYSRYPFALY